MKIVGRGVLDEFCGQHTDAKQWITGWLGEAETSNWATPQELKSRYPSASILAGNVVVFNVKGNEYRLEVLFAYKTGVIAVRWAGTHAEYDRRNTARR